MDKKKPDKNAGLFYLDLNALLPRDAASMPEKLSCRAVVRLRGKPNDVFLMPLVAPKSLIDNEDNRSYTK